MIAGIGEHFDYGLSHNTAIEAEAEVVDIIYVHLNALRPGHLLAPVNLRQPGNAGPHLEHTGLPSVIRLGIICQRRTRSDKRHVTFDDIEKLGKFVKARRPQKTPDAGDAVVAGKTDIPRTQLLGFLRSLTGIYTS